MNQQRKIPVRTCVSCRSSSAKRELIRIVKTTDGEIVIDQTGKMPGRGAYLCGAKECLALALKANKLNRALKCDIPEHIKENLQDIVVKIDVDKKREDDEETIYGS